MGTKFGIAIAFLLGLPCGSSFAQAGEDGKKEAATKETAVIENPLSKVLDAAARSSAMVQVQALVNAIKIYEIEYGVLPSSGAGAKEEPLPTGPGLIDILTGIDAERNPKQTIFIEGSPAKKAANGKPARSGFIDEGEGSKRLVDPWGNEYRVVLDVDYDKEIKIPGLDKPVRGTAVCWSYGKPGDPKDPKSALKNPPEKWVASWVPAEKKTGPAGGLFKFAKAKQKRIQHDLTSIESALKIYHLNAGTFPSTEQGLDALVKRPTTGRIPREWDPTLKGPLLDPWGKAYRYRFPGTRNKDTPDVWSLGEDGIDGTDDDVGNW